MSAYAQFLVDLRSYGVVNVTPTPAFDSYSWTGSIGLTPLPADSSDSCVPPGTVLHFSPWLPYGLVPDPINVGQWLPENACSANSSYVGASSNPIFWGWGTFQSLMSFVIGTAHNAGLGMNTFDYFQETNIPQFPVMARMIYDPKNNFNVLAMMQGLMTDWSFQSSRVSPSAVRDTASTAGFDCNSYYGDSAQFFALDGLLGAMAGANGGFGVPDANTYDGSNLLFCGGTALNAVQTPFSNAIPSFVDVHSTQTWSTVAQTSGWAQTYFSDLWTLLGNHGISNDLVMFGETNPVNPNNCDQYSLAQAAAILSGFQQSSLYGDKASVVFRPWERADSPNSCYVSPARINPPYPSSN